jgi:hypothetical protein
MSGAERRRSTRHLLGAAAEVHVGASTVSGVVQDVSRHGMGLVLPRDVEVFPGDTVWILAQNVAAYAITATVRRIGADGLVGVEFEEILSGEALDMLEKLPAAGSADIPAAATTPDAPLDPAAQEGIITADAEPQADDVDASAYEETRDGIRPAVQDDTAATEDIEPVTADVPPAHD